MLFAIGPFQCAVLAAALMLGADGVLIGSRFWASAEALVNPVFQDEALSADGDSTIHTTVVMPSRGW